MEADFTGLYGVLFVGIQGRGNIPRSDASGLEAHVRGYNFLYQKQRNQLGVKYIV